MGQGRSCIVARLPQPIVDHNLRDLLVVVTIWLLHLLLGGCHLIDHSSIVGEAGIIVCVSSR